MNGRILLSLHHSNKIISFFVTYMLLTGLFDFMTRAWQHDLGKIQNYKFKTHSIEKRINLLFLHGTCIQKYAIFVEKNSRMKKFSLQSGCQDKLSAPISPQVKMFGVWPHTSTILCMHGCHYGGQTNKITTSRQKKDMEMIPM